MSEPTIAVSALVVDCDDPGRVADFWLAMLGGDRVDFEEFGVVALRAPGVTFDFVTAEGDRAAKNPWHLDLAATDPAAMVAKALSLGATEAPDVCVSARFTVLRDVEGNEFCILNHATGWASVGPWAPPGDPQP
ncbi:MAG: VOC family protein [Acidimicrobiales bacterium]